MAIDVTIRTSEERAADKAAADAVRVKAEHLVKEWGHLVGRLRQNWSSMQDAMAAARLFGVEIDLPPDYPKSAPDVRPSAAVEPAPVSQPTLFEAAGETTIREAVLEQLKKAGEKGTKAAKIRQVIEQALGRQLHYKTVGMTLYRLSERGQAHREGYTWFFGSEAQKTKTPAS